MAKKYYGVKNGPSNEAIIFDNWPKCQAFIKGKFVKFKGFKTLNEAKEFVGFAFKGTSKVKKSQAKDTPLAKDAKGIYIYVDGSYMHKKSKYGGWGYVIVKDGIELISACGRTEKIAESRNIDGELEATINAINWSKIHINEPVTICHDYVGIAKWGKGEWKANKPLTQNYKKFMENITGVKFRKVAAHTGNFWNEFADKLAKKGILDSLK